MKGRKPKPTHLHLVNGNPGKRARNKKEPKPQHGRPTPPEHLSKEAAIHWGFFAAKLEGMGVLTLADGPALEELVETYTEVVYLRGLLDSQGYTQIVVDKEGNKRQVNRPTFIQYSDATKRLRMLFVEFGLTPSSRTRVNAAPADENAKDPARKYFS